MFFNNRIVDGSAIVDGSDITDGIADGSAIATTDDPLDNLLHTTYIEECVNVQTCTYLFLFISVVSVIVIFRK